MNATYHIEVSMEPVNVEGIHFYRWVVYEHTDNYLQPVAYSMSESPERAFVDAKMHYDRIVREFKSEKLS